jgi:hypothetical protein
MGSKDHVVGPYNAVVDAARESGLEHSTCDAGPWSEKDQAYWRSKDLTRLSPHQRALRSLSLEKLALGDDNDLVYEVFARLMDKEVFVGTRAMSVPERTVLLVKNLQYEISNGGFHQFFFNSTGNCAMQTLDALRRVAMPEWLAIYEKALAVFPSPPSEDRVVRNEQMAAIPDEGHAWEDHIDAFYCTDEDETARLAAYIRANLRDMDLPAH